MDIIIQSPRIRVSNRLERVLFEKFGIFEKPSYRIVRCEVVLRKEKSATDEGFVVEARLILPGNDLFARETASKFEIAAEEVCLELQRQLRKRKTKLAAKTRERSRARKAAVNEEELE